VALPVLASTVANTLGSVPTMAMPYVMRLVVDSSVHSSPTVQGLTLVPISARLELTLPLSAQLELTVSPYNPT
jgi:hypothetical protein